jgi:hypothetical protein
MKSPEELQLESQQLLVQFLRTELELGGTFVRSATMARDSGNVEHFTHAKAGATRAAESARMFVEPVHDARVREGIVEEVEELERGIAGL